MLRTPAPSSASTASRTSAATTAPAACRSALGELFPDDLADLRAVCAAGDLRHHVGHHAPEVGHARRPHLGDDVVDDLLDLVLGERLRHELLEDVQLALFRLGLFFAPSGAERLGRLDAPLPLPLQNLQLFLL